jgi:2-amino-4-hydroxy-6-hydroxymethyldihydropteridine diphosphokinase
MSDSVPEPLRVGIALGSNLGLRDQFIEKGFAFLMAISASPIFLKSTIFETIPIDCPPGSPPFRNAVVEMGWRGTARELLRKLQVFEQAQGRARVRPINSPRPLDLDILYCGDQLINEADLIVPHVRMTQRLFVMAPLAEIRPDLVLPGQQRTARAICQELRLEHE